MDENNSQALKEAEVKRKDKMRTRLTWLFICLDIALVGYLIYVIVTALTIA